MDLFGIELMYLYILIAVIAVWFVIKALRKIASIIFGVLSLYKLATWLFLMF